MTKVRYWSLDRFALMIVRMLLNKFDCFIIIEGNRGLGKSTFAYLIMKKVSNYFKIIQKETGGKNSPYRDWHVFKPKMQLKFPKKFKYIAYSQKDVINFLDKWHQSAIADEMINVAFNREFFSQEQKNLVKMINMNRDHCNLIIACVPQFQNLDNQIKNLCKIRVTVARRGIAVIQTPNRTIYNRDKWDSANNERIEREWLKKGTGLPQYSKLNTFRGMIKFPPLSPHQQWIYDEIKKKERNIIKGDLGVTNSAEQTPEEKIYDKLITGRVRSSAELSGMAFALGLTDSQLKGRLSKKLEREGKPTSLSYYYWDRKAKAKEKEELFA